MTATSTTTRAATLTVLLFTLALAPPASTGEDPGPPNVLWLTVEDMSPWIAAYGDRTVPTPNLDRLAREGVVFDHAYATSPVCAPARSSLITGMYATRIGTLHMRNGNPSQAALARDPEAYADIPSYEGVPPEFVRCFPELLRAAGYRCTNNAKTDYQFRAPVTVWDASAGDAHWRDRAEGQPFFAVFNHAGTHESRAFPDAKRAAHVVDPAAVPIPPFYPDTPEVRDALARTYDNIARMDVWVGERLRELDDAGLRDTTWVFVFSDHGVGLPRGKRSVYDTGTRVPLIVRAPRGAAAGLGPPGSRDDRVVQFVDLGPSVLSIAGIAPDPRLDGTPFLGPHARAGAGLAFAHADRFDAVRECTRSVTDGRFRYVRNLKTDVPYLLPNAYREALPMTAALYALRGSPDATPAQWQMAATTRTKEELYDVRADPWEVANLADDPAHRTRLERLRAALDAWMESTDDMGLVRSERDLVRTRIWPPDGKQPRTAQPEVTVVDARSGDTPRATRVAAITCATTGASIGYRVLGEDGGGPRAWAIWNGGPVELDPSARALVVQAHRIGFRPSEERIDLRGP